MLAYLSRNNTPKGPPSPPSVAQNAKFAREQFELQDRMTIEFRAMHAPTRERCNNFAHRFKFELDFSDSVSDDFLFVHDSIIPRCRASMQGIFSAFPGGFVIGVC